MAKRIYLCLAHMSEAGLEQKYIQEAFDTNWVVPLGPNVNGFEKDLEHFVNQNDNENEKLTKRVVALSSGTAAVHLGLLAAGVKRGDVFNQVTLPEDHCTNQTIKVTTSYKSHLIAHICPLII